MLSPVLRGGRKPKHDKSKEHIMLRFTLLILLFVSFVGYGIPAQAVIVSAVDVETSNHQEPNVGENTIDGSLSTRWAARGVGETIMYELEACSLVSRMHIAWFRGDLRVAMFNIEISDTGETWETVYEGNSNGETLDLEQHDIGEHAACYIRIVGLGNSINTWNSITEVRIENDEPPDRLPLPPPVVTASSFEDPNVPENTVDGNLDTRWSAQGEGEWIAYDRGEDAPAFSQVLIAWYRGNIRSATFLIETSEDGLVWNKIYSGYSSGQMLDPEPYGFAPASGRYVRITGFGNSQNNWNSLTEVAIGETP